MNFLTSPWRIYKLKRRVQAQRGTIIAQRDEIKRLRTEIELATRAERNADVLAARAQRNKLAATDLVARRIKALEDENEVLTEEVGRLRSKKK